MKPRGFSLLELLVVVAIVALASAGVSLSLRSSQESALETEALRLAALLEAGRAQSRSSGTPVRWGSQGDGFAFEGLPGPPGATPSLARHRAWLTSGTSARVIQPPRVRALVLGPEPLIAAAQVELTLGERRLVVGTDGLAPFAVLADQAKP